MKNIPYEPIFEFSMIGVFGEMLLSLLIPIVLFIGPLFLMKGALKEKDLRGVFISGVVSFGGLVFCFIGVGNMFGIYNKIIKPYQNTQYEIAEGKVEKLEMEKDSDTSPPQCPDICVVDGKKFFIGSGINGSYNKRACDGGYIREVGQFVKIYYVTFMDGNKQIVRLDIDKRDFKKYKD